MSKYAVLLEKAAPHTDLATPELPSAKAASPVSGQRAFAELAAKLFSTTDSGRVVAFVSATHGEGVTRTVSGLAAELARSSKTVLSLDGSLHGSPAAGMRGLDDSLRIDPTILGAPNLVETETASTLIASLRQRYDAILLDCGSLESSSDLLRLAPLSDWVLLVVEAGRTGKIQIDRAARVISEAGGTLAGCVLNKRRYPVPNWLYRLLQAR